MKYYETKIGKIIEKEFDSRMSGAVISYIIDKGWENVKEITDEQIENVKGNAIMSDRFVQSLVRAAREVTRQCNAWNDFLPFIRLYLPINDCQMKTTELYKEDYSDNTWKEVLQQLDLDDYEEEIEFIELSAVITNINGKGV